MPRPAPIPMLLLAAALLVGACQSYDRNADCDPDLGAEWHTCPDGSRVPWCSCIDGTWDCEPNPEQSCADIPECESDVDCLPGAWCDPCATSSCPGCDDCRAGCLPHGCPTEAEPECRARRPDCGDGRVAVVEEGCWICVDRQSCEPVTGRDERCDDGGALECHQARPECPDWEIASIQDGCWLCVNPETCRPWAEPGCAGDADCAPQQRCDDCARGSCPNCEDCVADCIDHGCSTQDYDALTCAMPRPDCNQGVAVIREGCWVCVGLDACAPIERDTHCDDGTQVLCDMPRPSCEEHEILAVRNDCWVCVNPTTCVPWGEAGCETDADCPAERWCNPCASGSCPMCPDCVPGCTRHGCPTEQQLECYCARPDCGPEAVAVIEEACWICVDAETCEPTGEGC